MNILIKNAGEIVTCGGKNLPKSGIDLHDLRILNNQNILICGEKISFIGSDNGLLDFIESAGVEVHREINAEGRVVMPGFVDSHTHFVFAGNRENEYEMRLAGKSYQEIAAAGGGIMSTVECVRKASAQELVEISEEKLGRFFSYGTTTIEGKSGYGLDRENELKMLFVLNELKHSNRFGMDIKATFLGAHAVPPGIEKDEYVSQICSDMIPEIAKSNLADYIDIFIEEGYFNADDADKILARGREHGLQVRTHIDQFTSMGGTEISLKHGAVSLDHLEVMSEADIQRLSAHNAVSPRKAQAGLLPGVSYFLGIPYAPARKLIEAGVPVLIATDFNPGSSMSQNIQMMMSLASTQMKMSAEEIISAVTINPAYSLGMESTVGSIEEGKQADILIFDMPSYKYLTYNFGLNNLEYVIKKGIPFNVNEINQAV